MRAFERQRHDFAGQTPRTEPVLENTRGNLAATMLRHDSAPQYRTTRLLLLMGHVASAGASLGPL